MTKTPVKSLNCLSYCDFCGMTEHEVELLISGPFGAHICSVCAPICIDVIKERRAEAAERADT